MTMKLIRAIAVGVLVSLTVPVTAKVPIRPTPGCGVADNVVAGLRLNRTTVGPVKAVQHNVPISPQWAVLISGYCSADLTGSRAGYFRLRSGASVELSLPLTDPRVGLRSSQGRTMIDIVEIMPVPRAGQKSPWGQLIALTAALDPSADTDRFAAVWSRRTGSVVGFVDIDRKSGRQAPIPLFEVPMKVRVAYYLPSPDTNTGDITILGPVKGGTKVITIGVGM